jgi:dihydroflavonol-4-reductase
MDGWDAVSTVNLAGTRNVLEACRASRVGRLVYFSSIHAYQQKPLDQPLDENRPLLDDPLAPPYERSKALAELAVRQAAEAGLDVVTIIPTAILGPYDFKPSYIGNALRLLAHGRLPALVRGGYNWVDVRDVVAGTLQAACCAPAGARYILAGHWVSVPQVARQVDHHTGRRALRPVVPLWLAELFEPWMVRLARLNGTQPLYTRPMLSMLHSNRLVSHARASRELGYAPRPFEQTLKETLEWLLAHQPGESP